MTVLDIQLFDPLPGKPQKRFVFRERFLLCASKIGQQAEVQVSVPICQESHFKRLDQILLFCVLMSIVGTTTSVRNSGGIPLEKSMRGNGWGFTSSVTSQFTRATAS